MNTLTAFMEYDGGLDNVFTHRTQADTIAGTVWRFIMDGNKTIVAVPYQSPHAPAKAAHCVPKRIESILAGHCGLGDFNFAVHYAAGVNDENCGRNWEGEIGEAAEAEHEKWKAKRTLPETARYEKARAQAHRDIEAEWAKKNVGFDRDAPSGKQFDEWKRQGFTATEQIEQKTKEHRQANSKERERISVAVFAEAERIKTSEAFKKEQKRIADHQKKIEAVIRVQIEKEKAARAAEIEADALAELGRALSAFGAKIPGKAKLKALFDFIREDVCRGNRINPVIRDADLRRVLAKVKELTGADMAERVFLSYLPGSPGMAAHVEEWTRETAKAEKIEEAEARRRVLERVRFVAAFPDGTLYLLQSISRCVHDERDAELFRLAAPDLAQRAEIKNAAQIEAKKRETIRLQQRTEKTAGRSGANTPPAGLHEIRTVKGQLVFRAMTPDFAEIEVTGKKYSLPPKGRRVVAEFVTAFQHNGATKLAGNQVLTKIDKGGESLANAFKGYKEAWDAVIRPVQGSRDLYEFIPAVMANAGEISGDSPP